MSTTEVREIVAQYQIGLARLQSLIELHQVMGVEYASPDLQAAANEVADLNARALEFVERPNG